MNINYDSLAMMAKFTVIMLGLLLLVFVLAVLTPKAAKIVDRLLLKMKKEKPSPPERVDMNRIEEQSAEIKGLYDAQLPEENDEGLSGQAPEACRYAYGKEIEDEQRGKENGGRDNPHG